MRSIAGAFTTTEFKLLFGLICPKYWYKIHHFLFKTKKPPEIPEAFRMIVLIYYCFTTRTTSTELFD